MCIEVRVYRHRGPSCLVPPPPHNTGYLTGYTHTYLFYSLPDDVPVSKVFGARVGRRSETRKLRHTYTLFLGWHNKNISNRPLGVFRFVRLIVLYRSTRNSVRPFEPTTTTNVYPWKSPSAISSKRLQANEIARPARIRNGCGPIGEYRVQLKWFYTTAQNAEFVVKAVH